LGSKRSRNCFRRLMNLAPVMRTAVLVLFLVLSLVARADEVVGRRLHLLPPTIELSSPESRQTVVAQWQISEQFEGEAAKGVTLESSDESVVKIEEGQAVPAGNGKAKIVANVDGKTALADVTVSGMEKPFQWNFRNHVESVLSKQGCNAGSCHGA